MRRVAMRILRRLAGGSMETTKVVRVTPRSKNGWPEAMNFFSPFCDDDHAMPGRRITAMTRQMEAFAETLSASTYTDKGGMLSLGSSREVKCRSW